MSWGDFFIIFIGCALTILICRVAPIFALKGRDLPESATRALNLIPPAAFAALIANDLFAPTMFEDGIVQGIIPLVSALLVMLVGYKTKSLVWCIVVGVGSYALFALLIFS